MTPELLSRIAGIVLSLALAYVPGVSTWYNALSSQLKVTVMGALLILASVGALLAHCGGVETACLQANLPTFLAALIAALTANQSAYIFLVKPFKR